MNRNTIGASGHPRSAPKQTMQIDAGSLGKFPKQPMQIPNGISFLSFGKGPSATADNKVLGNQQKQENLAAGHRHGLSMDMPLHTSAVNNTDTYKKSNDKNLQTEVSEASKLLEEFLFSSAG